MKEPKKSTNISNKLTEAWVLQDYYIKFNDQEICDQDIVEFEAMYGGCEIIGLIQFIDSKGILTDKESGLKSSPGFIKIGWTTCTGCEWEQEFFVSGIKSINNSKNQKLVQLDLIDKETRNFKGTFKNKNNHNVKFSEGIREAVNKHKTETKEIVISAPKKEQKLNLVIPANIDFHDYIKKICETMNYKFIKDKFNTYIVHAEHLVFDKKRKFYIRV